MFPIPLPLFSPQFEPSLDCATQYAVVADFETSAAPRFPAIAVLALTATNESRAACEVAAPEEWPFMARLREQWNGGGK